LNFSYTSNSGNLSIEIPEKDFIKLREIDKVIYTCNTGGYSPTDHFVEVKKLCEFYNYNFIIFTDEYIPSLDNENQIIFSYEAPNPRYAAKIFKILPHKFFINSKISLWIDSNVNIKESVFKKLDDFLISDFDIELFLHDKRKNIIDEAAECKKMLKDSASIIDEQISKYWNKFSNLEELGLFQGRILLRRNTNKTKEFSDLWINEILLHSIRDQLSLPIAIRESQVNLKFYEPINLHKSFKVLLHNKYNMYSDTKDFKNFIIMIRTKIIFKLVKLREKIF
jgi:hypothetical protein